MRRINTHAKIFKQIVYNVYIVWQLLDKNPQRIFSPAYGELCNKSIINIKQHPKRKGRKTVPSEQGYSVGCSHSDRPLELYGTSLVRF